MAGTDMTSLLRLIGEQLQPLDVEQFKYILEDSFTGKFHRNFSLLSLELTKLLKMFRGKTLYIYLYIYGTINL